jgi:tRNA threonylcarbamoyladenosine biosynthesis protein TsaB
VCRLARVAPTVDRDALLPEYVRPPDAVPRR